MKALAVMRNRVFPQTPEQMLHAIRAFAAQFEFENGPDMVDSRRSGSRPVRPADLVKVVNADPETR